MPLVCGWHWLGTPTHAKGIKTHAHTQNLEICITIDRVALETNDLLGYMKMI